MFAYFQFHHGERGSETSPSGRRSDVNEVGLPAVDVPWSWEIGKRSLYVPWWENGWRGVNMKCECPIILRYSYSWCTKDKEAQERGSRPCPNIVVQSAAIMLMTALQDRFFFSRRFGPAGPGTICNGTSRTSCWLLLHAILYG